MADTENGEGGAAPQREAAGAAPRATGRAARWVVGALVTAALVVLVAIGWTQRGRFTGAEVGARAPDFSAPSLDGGELSLSDYEGQVVLLNFWATWCPPCVREMPSMERLWQDMRDRGLVVLAVSVDAAPGEPDESGRYQGLVREYVDELGVTFPILLDPRGAVESLYSVTGLPTSYVIGRDGRIEGRVVGSREWDSEEYRERLQDLLGG